MAVKVVECVVCLKNENIRYKCPACRSPYCSVACCKEHKLNCSSSSSTVDERNPDSNISTEETTNRRSKYNYETEDTVPIEKLELLRHSEKLKDLLGNPHLRRMMGAIDSSEDAAKLIGDAMREPIFTEMVDECLQVINGRTNYGSDDEL
ncbi:unnamed protein product [Nesidiocoris tenuis]|uniref:Uncharacterized protein n=2 Tax=Nesidiocoris tenuis TaxID=355587 RepID=A0A6H5GB91_9HEMI|nr:HIT zinc finger [Nesidiocoris tenuis]CAA9999933.1 unnamed protein product [Nesidiocoris tenuis]